MRYNIGILLIAFLFACKGSDPNKVYYGEVQGTTFLIKYTSQNGDFENEIDSIFDLMDIEFSTYIEDSRISLFNQSLKGVPSSDEFNELMERSWEYNIASDGYFDPTIAPIFSLYHFDDESSMELDSAVVFETMSRTGLHFVKTDGDSILKSEPGIQLDFNAIAQGYTVDKVAELLEENGIEHYMIEIGGEIRALGKNAMGNTWTIGIDQPLESRERKIIDKVKLDGLSIATSGNYRKFKLVNGKKVGHIINPKTGWMKESNILSVSTFSKDCAHADAMATALMSMELDEIRELDLSNDHLMMYVIYLKGDDTLKYVSNGLKPLMEN